MSPVQISPSILSADFARLAEEVAAVPSADWIHVDVMDNHFVPNLTLGLPVVEALVGPRTLPLDCHLMIEDPDRWAPAYAEAGARCGDLPRGGRRTRRSGWPARSARPGRGPGWRCSRRRRSSRTRTCSSELDMVLLMSVEPGFGGQRFLDLVLPKMRRAREAIERHGGQIWLQIDGGVVADTIERCAEAGADVFVAGSAVYASEDPDRAVRELRAHAEATGARFA